MQQRDSSAWLLPALAVLALLFPLTAGRGPSARPDEEEEGRGKGAGEQAAGGPRGNQAASEKTASKGAASSSAALIQAFYGEREAAGGADAPQRAEVAVEFLIATLPDPVDSRFDYLFDRNLDAVQRALEDAGYVLDRFTLPWLNPVPTKEQELSPDRKFAEHPGAILLRRRDEEGRLQLLVLFLVGETPTSGIHKLALRAALQEIAGLPDAVPKRRVKPGKVRLLGPTFSGSETSLDLALSDWKSEVSRSGAGVNVLSSSRIVSGSATAIQSWSSKQAAPASYSIGGLDFHATVVPDEAALDAFFTYLLARGVHSKEIALLVEANTAYGRAATTAASEHKGAPKAQNAASKDERSGILTIPFPLHVDRLRLESKYTRSGGSAEEEYAWGPRHHKTTLRATEQGRARDVIPPLSRLQAPTLEPLTENVFRLVAQEGIRYVGILASDVRDLIFLAQELRDHCPNTALFTLNGDVLYLHPEVSLKLQGMQVLGTYPLFAANRIWTYPYQKATRVQLPMDIAMGIYNATQALLDRPSSMIEYGAPFSGDDGPRRPALWLTAVGRDGFWPIRTLPWAPEEPGKSKALSYVYSAETRKPAAPDHLDIEHGLNRGATSMALSFWCLGCLAICRLAWRSLLSQRRAPLPARRPRPAARIMSRFVVSVPRNRLEYRRRFYVLTFMGCLLLFHLLVCTVWCLPAAAAWNLQGWAAHHSNFPLAVSGFLFLVLAVFLAMILGTAASLIRSPKECVPKRGRASLRYVFIGCAVSLIFTLWQAGSWLSLPPQEAMLLYVRATAFQSGLSPLVPLMFVALGGFICAASVVRRLNVLEGDEHEELPVVPQGAHSLSAAADVEQDARIVVRCESSDLPRRAFYIIALLMVPPTLALFCSGFAVPFDEYPFFLLFALGFVTVYHGLAIEFSRFIWIWVRLRKLLRCLAWHPLGAYFSKLRVDGQEPRLPPVGLGGASHPLSLLEDSIERARILVRASGEALENAADPVVLRFLEVGRGLSDSLKNAQLHRDESFRAFASGDGAVMREQRLLAQKELASIAERVAPALESHWRSDHPQPAGTEGALRARLVEQATLFLAGRAVTFVASVLAQLQNLVTLVTAGLLLMLLAATSYPFQPRDWILLFNWSVVLIAVVTTMVVFVQMNQNQVLSALSGTAPGKTTWDRGMIFRVTMYGVLPILGLLGAQFPDTFGQLAVWMRSIVGGS